MIRELRALAVALAFAAAGGSQVAAAEAPAKHKPKPDLADLAQGVYAGAVISDSRGSSRNDVEMTVTKVGPNLVEVSSDYGRLPAFRTRLTRVMRTVQNAGGHEVFLLDTSKFPRKLDVTVDGASWSGTKSQ